MRNALVIAVAVGLFGLSGHSAFAQEASPPACVAQRQADRIQEAKDLVILNRILAEFEAKGFSALETRLNDLKAILERAPAHPVSECNGSVYVRAHTAAETLTAAMVGVAKDKDNGGRRAVVVDGPSPYAVAAFLLGSAAVERSDWVGADAVMKRGLEIDPGHVPMVGEEALVLSHLGRPADAVALCDQAIVGNAFLDKRSRARLLRGKGFALGDLGRFDEAIAAYQESLTFEPDHGGAMNEIAYLKKRKAGAPGIPDATFHYDQAKTLKPQN